MSRRRLDPKPFVLALAFALALAGRSAAAWEPAIHCRACAHTRDVVLMVGPASAGAAVAASSRLWMEQRSREAQRHHAGRSGLAMPVVSGLVEDVAGFRKLVQDAANDCLRVKVLGIIGHGDVGYFRIGGEGVGRHNVAEAFGSGMVCAMAPGATVEFFGCKVAAGREGASFLRSAGALLLSKGGRILAPESYVFGNPLLGVTPRPFFGAYRQIEFRRSGRVGRSETPAGNLACRDQRSVAERAFAALDLIVP